MTTKVTVSEFRENLSKYIDLVQEKKRKVDIVDGRKGKILATLIKKKKKEFDWDKHMEFLKNFKPFWTEEDTKHLKKLRRNDKEKLRKLNW